MRRSRFAPLLLALMLAQSACSPQILIKRRPEAQERIRVAILPFKDHAQAPGSGELAREAFTTQMIAVKNYDIIERGALDTVLQEQKLGLTGVIDQDTATQIGKLLGANAVVIGSVTQFHQRKALIFPPARVSLSARLIDIKTGQIEWSAEQKVGGSKRLFWWLFWPAGIVATVISPTAEDQVLNASKDICRSLARQMNVQE
ncbi:MAG: GNA1162 family protein [Elusimicrobiota bacterium]